MNKSIEQLVAELDADVNEAYSQLEDRRLDGRELNLPRGGRDLSTFVRKFVTPATPGLNRQPNIYPYPKNLSRMSEGQCVALIEWFINHENPAIVLDALSDVRKFGLSLVAEHRVMKAVLMRISQLSLV